MTDEFLELRIANGRRTAGLELKNHREDDVAILPLESTRAITKAAIRVRQPRDLSCRAIEYLHAHDGLADVLPIRANVLNRGRAGRAGDSGETFDPRPTLLNCHRHDFVPRLAGRDFDQAFTFDRDAAQPQMQ